MASLEDLRIRIIGDESQYVRSMTAAAIATNHFAQSIEQTLANAAAANKSVQTELKIEVEKLTKSLREQALTFGMTASQAKIAVLQLRGATDEQLRMARAADASITTQGLDKVNKKIAERTAAEEAAALERGQRLSEAGAAKEVANAQKTAQQVEDAYMDALKRRVSQQSSEQARIREQQEADRQKQVQDSQRVLERVEQRRLQQQATDQKNAARTEQAHMDELLARVRTTANEQARIRQQKEEETAAVQSSAARRIANEQARLRFQDEKEASRLELADNQRIHNKIEAETKAVLAAARAREAQEAATKQTSIQQGGMSLQQAFDFSVSTARSAIDAFSDFNLAMTQSTAIMKITSSEIEQMSQAALDMSHKFAFSATDIAKAFYYLASSGMNPQEAMRATPAVLQFASAGAMEVGAAANYAVAAVSALGLASKDTDIKLMNMTHVMDMVTRASKIALGTTEQYAKALTRDAATSMRTYNISLTEGIALLTAYHNAGIQGAMAGNMMGRAIRLIFASTVTAPEQQRRFGFLPFDPATGLRKQMPDIIKNLKEVLDQYEEEAKPLVLKKLGFETLAQKSILPLIDQSDQIAESMKKLRGAGGTIEEISIKQMEAFANQMQLVVNSVREAAIVMGKELVPVAMMLGRVIQTAADVWSGMNGTLRTGIVTVLEYATAFGGIVLLLSQAPVFLTAFTNGLTFLSAHPVLAVAAGLTLVASASLQAIMYIGGLRDEINALNLAMKDQAELNAKLHGARAGIAGNVIERAAQQPNIEDRKKILKDSLHSFEQDIEAQKKRKAELQAQLAGIGRFQKIREGAASIITGDPSKQEVTTLAIADIIKHLEISEASAKKVKEALENVFNIKPKKRTIELEIHEELDKVLKDAQYEGLTPDQRKSRELGKRGDVSLLDKGIALQEARKREVEVNKEVIKTIEDMNHHIAAHKVGIGDTAREVQFYKLTQDGATQAQLFLTKSLFEQMDAFEKKEALLKKAIQTTKESFTPEQKYAEKQAELKEMLKTIDPATGKAIISQETYNQSIIKAAKELTGAKNAAQGFTAALFGSAEAISRLEAQRDALSPVLIPFAEGGGRIPEKIPKYNIPGGKINSAVLGAGGLGALAGGFEKSEKLSEVVELLKKINESLEKKKTDLQVFDELVL